MTSYIGMFGADLLLEEQRITNAVNYYHDEYNKQKEIYALITTSFEKFKSDLCLKKRVWINLDGSVIGMTQKMFCQSKTNVQRNIAELDDILEDLYEKRLQIVNEKCRILRENFNNKKHVTFNEYNHILLIPARGENIYM
jgi:hypothetical protein